MSHQPIFTIYFDPPAEKDVDEIFKWYEEQRPGLGYEFLISLDKSLTALTTNPNAFFCVYRNVRRIVISRFPYNGYYTINNETVLVHAVMHQHKNPAEWQLRL